MAINLLVTIDGLTGPQLIQAIIARFPRDEDSGALGDMAYARLRLQQHIRKAINQGERMLNNAAFSPSATVVVEESP